VIKVPPRTKAVIAQAVSVRTDGEITIWTDGHILLSAPAAAEMEVSGKNPAPPIDVIREQILAPALAELAAGRSRWDLHSDDTMRMLRSDLGDLNWSMRTGEFSGPLSGIRLQCPALAYLDFPKTACICWGYVCEALAHILGRAPRCTDTVAATWSPCFRALLLQGLAYPQTESAARVAIVMGVRP
jgi:hypothetical protein